MKMVPEWVFFISFFGLNETIQLIKINYKMFNILRPLIFKFNPEMAHSLAIKALKLGNMHRLNNKKIFITRTISF